jgi:ketosteroid isomerase-like protein
MTQQTTARTERNVIELIDAFGIALFARDLEASMALLADMPDLAVIPSEGVDVYRGPQAVRAFLDQIYNGPRRYGWVWDDRWISVDDDAATFVAVGTETVDEGNNRSVIPYCLTGVAVSTSGGWRLKLLHASEDSVGARA